MVDGRGGRVRADHTPVTPRERKLLRSIIERWRGDVARCRRIADEIDDDDFRAEWPEDFDPHGEGSSYLRGGADFRHQDLRELEAMLAGDLAALEAAKPVGAT